jgi:Protein of unknown function (DUF3341)
MRNDTSKPENRLAGVLGFFENADAVLAATEKVKNANYGHFDVFTPYPIHGLEHAQGLKRSPIPYVTFIAGLTGFLLAFLFEYWTSAVDWPINVGGKPYNSWPAFVPIMFELTVLFAGLCTVGAMFAFNGLPNLRRKAFDPSLTNNRFAIVIETPPPAGMDAQSASKSFKAFSESEAAQFLKQAGASEVRSVYSEGWF